MVKVSKELVELNEGDKAPDFKLTNQEGERVILSEFIGKKVILYFYPRDFTSGCTKQACIFRDNFGEIKDKGTVILGISADDKKSHSDFVRKYNLPFVLLSDEGNSISKMYGVYKLKNFYGKKFMGIERSTFIINEEGYVNNIFRKVKVDRHLQEVLESLN